MKSLIDEMKVHDIIMEDTNISPYITKTQCYYFGDEESDNSIYFNVVMEKCKFDVGKYLEHLKNMRTSPSEAFVGRFIECMLPGLKYLHEKQLFHRDLKLGNILIYEDENKNWIFKICDFGFTRPADNSDTDGSHGTPAFMAPELLQANGKKRSSKSDVWALGISLYYMITGELPYPKVENKMALLLHISRLPQLSSNIPAIVLPYNSIISNSMTDLVNKMLIVDPANRISVENAIRQYEEECKTIEEENQEIKRQQAFQVESLAKKEAEFAAAVATIEELRNSNSVHETNAMEMDRQTEQLRADVNVQMVQIREKDTELNTANATIEDLLGSIENLQNSNNDHEVNAVTMRQQVEQLCAEHNTANDTIQELQSNINDLETNAVAMRNENERLVGNIHNKQLEVNNALEELRRVKEILSARKALLVEEYKKEFPKGTPIVCACEKGRFEDVKLLITGIMM
jgi:serine/threonine protein kinase